MNTIIEKPIGPKWHALIDYALVGSLLTLPSLLGINKKAKIIYAAEALVLLPYVALTKQPVALKGFIPIETHGKIDPFNVAQFALQSFFKPFRQAKKELIFNVAFTAIAGLTVLLTNYKERAKPVRQRTLVIMEFTYLGYGLSEIDLTPKSKQAFGWLYVLKHRQLKIVTQSDDQPAENCANDTRNSPGTRHLVDKVFWPNPNSVGIITVCTQKRYY